MTVIEAVKTCLREKYATFSGRASRAEFWYFHLCMVLFLIVWALLFVVTIGGMDHFRMMRGIETGGAIVAGLGGILALALIIPSVSVTVRRFHDVNLSGWWVLGGWLLGGLPMIGLLATLAMLGVAVIKGSAGDNRFGPDPLAGADPAPQSPIL